MFYHVRCSQVIDETLSPTWDEMLVMQEVSIYGLMEEIAGTPPTIVVEIFDQDKVVREKANKKGNDKEY